jgi:hypothetical protein
MFSCLVGHGTRPVTQPTTPGARLVSPTVACKAQPYPLPLRKYVASTQSAFPKQLRQHSVGDETGACIIAPSWLPNPSLKVQFVALTGENGPFGGGGGEGGEGELPVQPGTPQTGPAPFALLPLLTQYALAQLALHGPIITAGERDENVDSNDRFNAAHMALTRSVWANARSVISRVSDSANRHGM